MTDQTFERFDFRNSTITKSVQGQECPWRRYAELAGSERMVRTDGVVNLFRRDDIMKVNRNTTVLGQGGAGPSLGGGNPIIPNEIDGEPHKKFRKVLNPLFSPQRIAPLEQDARELANKLIDGFADAGEVEVFTGFCEPFTAGVFLRVLDAPAGDLEFIRDFSQDVIHPRGESVEEIMAVVNAAGDRMNAYIAKLMFQRRDHLDVEKDLISALLDAQIDGQPIADADVNMIVYTMLLAGLDTTASALSLVLAVLAREPRIRQRLVDEPELIPGAIEEILRRENPVPANNRFATEDIDLGDGLVIAAGETIHEVLGAANVDPTAFDEPLVLRIDEPRRENVVFSSGTHRCLGSHLARLELRVGVEEFLRRIPNYGVKPGEEVRYENIAVRKAEYLPLVFGATPSR